jgi:hypothetical protein
MQVSHQRYPRHPRLSSLWLSRQLLASKRTRRRRLGPVLDGVLQRSTDSRLGSSGAFEFRDSYQFDREHLSSGDPDRFYSGSQFATIDGLQDGHCKASEVPLL